MKNGTETIDDQIDSWALLTEKALNCAIDNANIEKISEIMMQWEPNETFIIRAIKKKQEKVTLYLLEHTKLHPDIMGHILHLAIDNKLERVALKLIDDGANLKIIFFEETALHNAILHGLKDVMVKILEKGGDIEEASYSSGKTPLLHAISNGDSQMAMILINKGANLQVHWRGAPLLFYAIHFVSEEVILAMVTKLIQTNKSDLVLDGAFLKHAFFYKKPKISLELIKLGSLIKDDLDLLKESVFGYKYIKNMLKIIKTLIKKNKSLLTSLFYHSMHGNQSDLVHFCLSENKLNLCKELQMSAKNNQLCLSVIKNLEEANHVMATLLHGSGNPFHQLPYEIVEKIILTNRLPFESKSYKKANFKEIYQKIKTLEKP